MFELFIALFGGLFYTSKYFNEKAKLKAFDDRQREQSATLADIESKYSASLELEQWAKDFISSGDHYDEICTWFAEDFRYALGRDWKEKLRIPTKFLPMARIYDKRDYPWLMPSAHVMWVYHLLLAKHGKIDHYITGFGYPIGGINERDMSIKFAECIEGRLLNAGVRGIRLALELNMIGTRQRTISDLCGGDIKIESLCNYPTHRLWDDYVQK